jgi:3-dehydroquinate synthase
VIKHALIEDSGLFEFLEIHTAAILARDSAILLEMLRRSCEIKQRIV